MADDDELVPVGDVLTGMNLLPLGDGVVALDAVVLIKAIDPAGNIGWWTRWTKDLTTVESIGALHAAIVLEEDHLRSIYRPYEDDSD